MYIDVCGLKINYEIYGEGKEVVLLHGWGAGIPSFAPVAKHLSGSFKVIVPDFPGFGGSQPPPAAWGVPEYAEFTREFLNRLNVKNPILVGHSFGGRIIIYLTGKLKVPARKVVLVDSAGIRPRRSLNYYYRVYTFKMLKRLARLIFSKEKAEEIIAAARNKHGSTDYKNASGVMREVMVKAVNEDLKQYLPGMGAPVLLIWGENDEVTPVSDGKTMERLIPDAGLVVLKGAGHFSYLDRLADFNIIVDNFLGE